MIAVAPSDLTALELFQHPLRSRQLSPRAQHQLPKVLLTNPEMETEPQHEQGTDGLRGWARIAFLVRHQSNDLLGDLPVLSDRACRFEDRHDGFEWIAMHTGNALDFLHAVRGVLMEIVAGAMPIFSGVGDFVLRDEAGDRLDARQKFGMLS